MREATPVIKGEEYVLIMLHVFQSLFLSYSFKFLVIRFLPIALPLFAINIFEALVPRFEVAMIFHQITKASIPLI